MTKLVFTLHDLLEYFRYQRFRCGTEADLQEDIWAFLQSLQMHLGEPEREVRLAPGERIDFVVRDNIGIEAKVKCSKRHIYRQLERYAKIERLKYLILVTGTALGLPSSIDGKPVFYVSLGRAAL